MDIREIATVARTTEILDEYDLFPKKGYGQNFIIEPQIVRHIAEHSGANKEMAVIEIGPGIGALTQQLSFVAGDVLAYEIDEKLLGVLPEIFEGYDNIQIIGEDFLKRDLLKDTEELRKKYDRICFCANLPYYVTTPIIFHIIESGLEPESLTFMVQKEMADRFNAKQNSKDYNALSVLLQYLYDIKVVMKVPPTIFIPKPKVDSIVIRFVPKKDKPEVKDFAEFSKLVEACFVQRRKTLYNNLKEFFNDKDKAMEVIFKAGLDEKSRAESLAIQDFIHLYEASL